MKTIDEKLIAKRRPGVPGAGLYPVTMQRLAEDRCRWRVGFCGQGRYFKNKSEAWRYIRKRFGEVRK